MKLIIETSDNGIKVKGTDINAVYETEDDINKQQEFLYDLIDTLGWYQNKYSEKKLQIDIVHGNSFECVDKDCSLCINKQT